MQENTFNDGFDKIFDAAFERSKDKTKIGIIPRYNPLMEGYEFPQSFPNTIQNIGAIPILIPYCSENGDLSQYIGLVDAIVTIGGFDVDPSGYTDGPKSSKVSPTSPQYDNFEFRAIRMAYERGISALGICRGMQVMNVGFGGTMYQDLHEERTGTTYMHQQGQPWDLPTHDVEVKGGTVLAGIVGAGNHRVNTMHHQAVKEIAPGFEVSALSTDGVVEGIERTDRSFFIGVQWHPEEMNGIMRLENMLRALDAACQKQRENRKLEVVLSTDAPSEGTARFGAIGGPARMAYQETNGISMQRCQELFDEAGTPDNVRAHCAATAKICKRMAENLNAVGYDLDVQLCASAGMLHDICRVKKNHSRVGARFLREHGYDEIAKIVYEHDGFEGLYPKDFDEQAIVCFADKLVQNDKVVTLDKRYGKAIEYCKSNPKIEEMLVLDLEILKRIKARYEKLTGDVII